MCRQWHAKVSVVNLETEWSLGRWMLWHVRPSRSSITWQSKRRPKMLTRPACPWLLGCTQFDASWFNFATNEFLIWMYLFRGLWGPVQEIAFRCVFHFSAFPHNARVSQPYTTALNNVESASHNLTKDTSRFANFDSLHSFSRWLPQISVDRRHVQEGLIAKPC